MSMGEPVRRPRRDRGGDSPVERPFPKHEVVESDGRRVVAHDKGARRGSLRIEDPFEVRMSERGSAPCFGHQDLREPLGCEAKDYRLLEAVEPQTRSEEVGADLGIGEPSEQTVGWG
jgi:hypothetical protein